MLTTARYTLGGTKAITDNNNRIDFVNSIVAMYGTQATGNLGAGISIATAIVTTQLSSTHEQIVKSKINDINIWPLLSSIAEKYVDSAEINLGVFDSR